MSGELAVVEVPAHTRVRGHGHEGLHLCVTMNGRFEESDRHGEKVLNSGDIRLSPSIRRTLRFGPEGAQCLIYNVSAIHKIALSRPLYEKLPCWAAEALNEVCLSDHFSARHHLELELIAEDLVHWISSPSRRTGDPPRWLVHAREALILAPDILEVQEIARHSGVHRVHLSRSFHAFFGQTLCEFRQRVRGARVLRLLQEGGDSIAAVAMDAGFSDQAHLCRWTRNRFNMTPAALRAMLRLSNTSPVLSVNWPNQMAIP